LRGVLDESGFDVVLRGYERQEVHAAIEEWFQRLDAQQQAEPVQSATDGEMRFLDPKVRSSVALLGEILDPEFTEIGSSGRLRDRAAVLAGFSRESHPAVSVAELSGRLIAPGIVHLSYVSEEHGRRTRRSSLWRRPQEGWRLYFHQETLSPENIAPS
jgi:hypothetical protein